MEKQFQCTKIKDGLYLGNIRAAQDLQFLITNKFSYIVNCTSEVPNYFEDHGLKYVKFKLIRDKGHKLWQQDNLKKLAKLQEFIDKCQKNSLCCLIHSFDGTNRSLVMLCALLMSRYKWTVAKTLEYIRSKNIFIGLSQHNMCQLENLQHILEDHLKQESLSRQWRIQYKSQEEEILSKTYLNSQQIQNNPKQIQNKEENQHKVKKKVSWQDKIDKQKEKEKNKERKQKSKTKPLIHKEQNNFQQFNQENIQLEKYKYPSNQIPREHKEFTKITKQIPTQKSCKTIGPPLSKKNKNYTSNYQINRLAYVDHQNIKLQKPNKPEMFDELIQEDEILKLIKKNLNKKNNKKDESQNKDKIYNLTINNFIQPNINIVGNPGSSVQKSKKIGKNRPNSTTKDEKINRTLSQKEGMKAFTGLLRQKNCKIKQKDILSPKRKQLKTEKTKSFQKKK